MSGWRHVCSSFRAQGAVGHAMLGNDDRVRVMGFGLARTQVRTKSTEAEASHNRKGRTFGSSAPRAGFRQLEATSRDGTQGVHPEFTAYALLSTYLEALALERLSRHDAAADAYAEYLQERPYAPEAPTLPGRIEELRARARDVSDW